MKIALKMPKNESNFEKFAKSGKKAVTNLESVVQIYFVALHLVFKLICIEIQLYLSIFCVLEQIVPEFLMETQSWMNVVHVVVTDPLVVCFYMKSFSTSF